MQQQINLYLPEFQVKKDALSFVLMLQGLAALVLILSLISAYDLFTRWQLDTELVSLRETLATETSKTSAKEEELSRRAQNTDLRDQLRLAEVRLEGSRQIRNFLSDRTFGNVVGFSEYFKDLSRAAIDGLSLTGISFTEGGDNIELSGRVVRTTMVPLYVRNIEQGQSPLRSEHYSASLSRANDDSNNFLFVLTNSDERGSP